MTSTLTVEQIERWRQDLLDGNEDPSDEYISEANTLCDMALSSAGGTRGRETITGRWKLTPVLGKYKIIPSDPIIDPVSGKRSGIQYGPMVVEDNEGTDECPICTVVGPHAHSLEDIETLEKMIKFLRDKIGAAPSPAPVPEGKELNTREKGEHRDVGEGDSTPHVATDPRDGVRPVGIEPGDAVPALASPPVPAAPRSAVEEVEALLNRSPRDDGLTWPGYVKDIWWFPMLSAAPQPSGWIKCSAYEALHEGHDSMTIYRSTVGPTEDGLWYRFNLPSLPPAPKPDAAEGEG